MSVGHSLSLSILALVLATPPTVVVAQSEQELRQQLEAQKAINEQLRRRVEELERELSGELSPSTLQPSAAPPPVEPETFEAITAIEEALVSKGLVLLPRGTLRLAPGLDWTHSGSQSERTRSDTYRGSVTVQAGLPWGMMFAVVAPYVYRDTAAGWNSGMGDLSVELSRKFANESKRRPSFVASLGYSHDNGADPFERVPIGFGFRVLSASVSALKRVDPLAVYGTLSYAHVIGQDVRAAMLFDEAPFTGRIEPGDSWAYRAGISLAATPDITLDASLSGAFVRHTHVDSAASGEFTLPRSTIALVNLGAGFVLSKDLSMLITASVGATSDSPDFILSLSLPYRF